MAHYRKIDTQIWNDRKFNQLGSDSKLVFFFLLSHPHLTSLGAMRGTLPGLACELGWTLDRFETAFQELSESEMVCNDRSACFIWLPNFLKYNQPESPNVVKSWEMAWSNLPECDLKCLLGQTLTTFLKTLPTTFQDALPDCFNEASLLLMQGLSNPSERVAERLSEGLPEGFRKTSLNQEQEQEQKLKQKQEQKQEQQVRKILAKNNFVETETIEEINNLVTPTRQKNAKPPDDAIADVFRYWQKTLGHPQAVLDAKRRKRIHQALASGYSAAQLCDAILGCSYTPHNMGHNEQGQRYDGLHVILRDADQIDRFIRNAHSPPRLQNAADKLANSNIAVGQQWFREKLAQGNTYEQA